MLLLVNIIIQSNSKAKAKRGQNLVTNSEVYFTHYKENDTAKTFPLPSAQVITHCKINYLKLLTLSYGILHALVYELKHHGSEIL